MLSKTASALLRETISELSKPGAWNKAHTRSTDGSRCLTTTVCDVAVRSGLEVQETIKIALELGDAIDYVYGLSHPNHWLWLGLTGLNDCCFNKADLLGYLQLVLETCCET